MPDQFNPRTAPRCVPPLNLRPPLISVIEPPNAAQTNAHDGKRRKRGLRAIDGLAGAVFGAGTGEAVVLWGGLTLGVWAFAVRPGGPPMGRLASVVAGVLLLGILGRAIYLLISASPHRH